MLIKIPEPEAGVQVTEVPSVKERAKALGVKIPDGLCALPNDFFTVRESSELDYLDEILDAKAIFKEIGETLKLVERDDGKIPYVSNQDDTWVGPVLYIGAVVLTRNPELLRLTVQTVVKHVSDLFKAVVGMKRVKMSYVVEDPKTNKTHKLDYNGPVEQLPEILKVIKGLK